MPGYRKTQNVDLDKMSGFEKKGMPKGGKKGMGTDYHSSKEGKIKRIMSGLKKMKGGGKGYKTSHLK